jgi:hypothetical protein
MMEMTRYTMRLAFGRCWWTPAKKPASSRPEELVVLLWDETFASTPFGDHRRGHMESLKSAEDIEMKRGSDIIYLLLEGNWRD